MTETKHRISIEVTPDERKRLRLDAAALDLSLTALVKFRALGGSSGDDKDKVSTPPARPALNR